MKSMLVVLPWVICCLLRHDAVLKVPTHGLLNTIGVPQLGEGSPYQAMHTGGARHVSSRSLLWVSALPWGTDTTTAPIVLLVAVSAPSYPLNRLLLRAIERIG